MNKVKIESIEEGAIYDGAVWDYWISVTLNSGRGLRIFDPQAKAGELKSFVGIEVFFQIKALYVQTKEDDALEKFEGVINRMEGQFMFKNDEIEIILDESDITENGITPGQVGLFHFGRLDLVKYEII